MKVLIETRGGVIVNIYSDTPDVQVKIKDWDDVNDLDKFTTELDEPEYEIY